MLLHTGTVDNIITGTASAATMSSCGAKTQQDPATFSPVHVRSAADASGITGSKQVIFLLSCSYTFVYVFFPFLPLEYHVPAG